ncbi:Protein unc-50 [Tetrabaena socialis]|uniref:Protein unc-50 n=1 Tax=Tetrabaena socialis TaxID=47790 RepID=A0A2J7ZSQ3_9CHLO|nr:Protein unc-50 [Tetrabaena socialis]|eukprot:PNH03270.1 Protein unc-50 [Tetrabaena socialis]
MQLPTSSLSASTRPQKGHLTAYIRRLLKPKQWDLEYTFWLMMQLCFSPKTAYRHTAYHKQTKNQWARDDPAFIVVCCALVACASLAYCVTFGDTVWHTLMTVLSAVLVDFLVLGVAVATACWLYAFDVHCNSYFPLFLLLYVLQFLLCPVLLWRSYLSSALSNALYVIALSVYHYMNFLGYGSLPFLERTEVFLWPIGVMLLLLPFAVLSGFNPSIFTLSVYFG